MNIYFSGIGGVGLAPLAQMALDAGHTVAGSDIIAGLATDELKTLGVEVHIGEQIGEYLRQQHELTPFNWFVYSAALPEDHPELVEARALGIKTTKRDALLARLIDDSGQKLIAIAGTHGKTTTTGMFIWTMRELGIPVSYSVGSQLGFGPSGKFDPDAKYFVYECDEFDRNFLKFQPCLSLITSIGYDHPDTYPTENDYKRAFSQYVSQSEVTIMWQEDASYADIQNENAWILQPHEVLDLYLGGHHNRKNATLVIKALERLGIGDTQLNQRNIEIFPGTMRRFERLADNLYSDYGHHPTEIAATLQMAKEFNQHVVLVYQPHQNVRQHEVRNQYVDDIFVDADEIYWLPTYLSREDPALAVLTPEELTKDLNPSNLHFADFNDDLWNEIQRHRDATHLVLCMGAGSIDSWVRKYLATKQ